MTASPVEIRSAPVAREKAFELARRMLSLVASGSTDRAEAIWEVPVERYLDTARFAAEVDVLFHRTALLAGLSAEVAHPGSYKTLDLPGFPLIIARDQGGNINAFANVCRHRSSRLVEGTGTARRFSCPYHGWSYDLDGRLRSVRACDSFGEVDFECHGLVRVAAAERYGMIFVRATPVAEDPRALDVGEILGPELSLQMGQWELGQLEAFQSASIDTSANWKLTLDTYLETYHFAVLHPATVAKTHYADHTPFDIYGRHALMGFTGKSISKLAGVPEDEWEPLKHLQFIYVLFPNVVFTVMRDHVEYFQILPGGAVDRSATNHVYFTLRESPYSEEDVARDRFDRTHGILVEEDCPMAETMQRNIETRAVKALVFGRNEPVLQHMHRRFDDALAGA